MYDPTFMWNLKKNKVIETENKLMLVICAGGYKVQKMDEGGMNFQI